jgi:hypothetical protein
MTPMAAFASFPDEPPKSDPSPSLPVQAQAQASIEPLGDSHGDEPAQLSKLTGEVLLPEQAHAQPGFFSFFSFSFALIFQWNLYFRGGTVYT